MESLWFKQYFHFISPDTETRLSERELVLQPIDDWVVENWRSSCRNCCSASAIRPRGRS